ncbi:MAG TPA: PEGA domain-containing protein, partial [Polyangia bacterium]
ESRRAVDLLAGAAATTAGLAALERAVSSAGRCAAPASQPTAPAPATQPAAPRYRIEIRSEPAGAVVVMDRHVVGRTPLAIQAPAGDHRLVVGHEGYTPWRRDLAISRDAVYEVALARPAAELPDTLRAAARELHRGARDRRIAAAVRLGRQAGADRVLAFEVLKGRLRAQVFDVASGSRLGGLYEADAAPPAAVPADLAAALDGAAAAAPPAPGKRPASGFGKRWWHWAVAAAGAVALGFAIYQSEKGGSGDVTFRIVKP